MAKALPKKHKIAMLTAGGLAPCLSAAVGGLIGGVVGALIGSGMHH